MSSYISLIYVNVGGCSKNLFLFFCCQSYIQNSLNDMTVSFIRKEMSRHLKDKFSEMEGGQTPLNGSYFMS